MKIKVLTLFPEMFETILSSSILGRAVQNNLLSFEIINIRDYSQLKHKNADDYPFGGGAGMVMLAQPIVDAIEKATEPPFSGKRIYMSPRGATLTQEMAQRYSKESELLILCGHYEGVDQRALDLCIDEELSIGDYVLTGGELPAMVLIDTVARLIPGVLGSDESPVDESFSSGLLEYPQYTRPREFRGLTVPEVLLNGDHAKIARWRRDEALKLTHKLRPEMIKQIPLDKQDMITMKRLVSAKNDDI